MAGSVLCFSFWCAAMGLSRWFFVETKSFEFAMEEGVSVSRGFERSRGIMCSTSMGKVTVLWLLAILEELLKAETSKVFLKFTRVGSKAYIVQRCANRFGHYLFVAEYCSCGQRGFIVVPERGGKGWSGFVHELRKTTELSQASSDDGQKASPSRSTLPHRHQ
jgi:hypothetical protein